LNDEFSTADLAAVALLARRSLGEGGAEAGSPFSDAMYRRFAANGDSGAGLTIENRSLACLAQVRETGPPASSAVRE
jgi:hypothetical protein